MKTNTGKNKMKTLNKKNLETINNLLHEIDRNRNLSKDLHDEKGCDFWFSLKCYYQAKLNAIKLFEEFGICYEIKAIIERWITEKDKIEEEIKQAHDYWLMLEKEKDKKSA